VFLDLQLAGERGEPLLDELRGHVPVAVVSGTAGEDAGADAVLTKPFAPAELAETVRRLSPTIVER
jgi:DNA-binding response OmpR family regulator